MQQANKIRNSFLLFSAAFIWGAAFVAQSVGMDYMGPHSFNGARFLLGGIVLLPLVFARQKRKDKEREKSGRPKENARAELQITLFGGICCGLALCAASTCQQIGIMQTTVGKAGFITTLYIIIVPIMGIFLKKKVPPRVWAGAVIAAFGMYLLCMKESLALSRGDTWVFICAILFSVHILVIDHFSPKADGVTLSCIQFFTAGIVSSIAAVLLEQPGLQDLVNGIVPLLYAGIMSSGVGYTLQIIGQKDMDPTVASLILSLESVISMLAGWVILKQRLSARELLGCAVVFAAVILVQLPERKKQAQKA